MRTMFSFNKKHIKNAPKCLGTGLISLDLIYKGMNSKPYVAAGGSCGNVMSILSRDGWETYPAGLVGTDIASEFVKYDLRKQGVCLDLLTQSSDVQTPVIIEFVVKNNINFEHKFSRTCHKSKKRLPRYTSISNFQLFKLLNQVSNFDIYYFDRLDEHSLALAKKFKELGKIVFFEPQEISCSNLFNNALSYVDILKLSSEYVSHKDLEENSSLPYLTILTQGSKGLTYVLDNKETFYLPANSVTKVKDASGCGDWLSSSIIDTLCKNGLKALKSYSAIEISSAIQYGQYRSRKNLNYWGARGGMYNNLLIPYFKRMELKGIKASGRYMKIKNKDFKPVDLLASI